MFASPPFSTGKELYKVRVSNDVDDAYLPSFIFVRESVRRNGTGATISKYNRVIVCAHGFLVIPFENLLLSVKVSINQWQTQNLALAIYFLSFLISIRYRFLSCNVLPVYLFRTLQACDV